MILSAEDLGMTEEQRLNLARLAVGLHDADEDELHVKFNMGIFAELGYEDEMIPPGTSGSYEPGEMPNACGTYACAAGHGPIFGIGVLPDHETQAEDIKVMGEWAVYVRDTFGAQSAGDSRGEDDNMRWILLFDESLQPTEDREMAAQRMLCYLRAGWHYMAEDPPQLAEEEMLGEYVEQDWDELRRLTGPVVPVK